MKKLAIGALVLLLGPGLSLLSCAPGEAPPDVAQIEQPVERDTQGTVVYQQGSLPDASYQHAGADVWAYEPDMNYGTDALFLMGVNGNFGWPYLHFDLQGRIPAGATVVSAAVEMYAEAAYSYGYTYYQTGSAHRVLSSWTESGLTYNTKPPDWNNGVFESSTFITGAGQWWAWDVTQMATAWVADPASNFGVAIIPTDSLYDGDFIVWRSDDYATPSYRPRLTITYLLPEHRAAFVSQVAPPATMGIGQQAAVQLVFRNDGADTWSEADGYGLGSQAPQDNTTWGLSRITLPGPVAGGQQAVFDFVVTAPAAPGVYDFQWQMVDEPGTWFGDTSPLFQVNVTLLPNGSPCTDLGQCQNGLCVDGYCCDSSCVGPCRTCARADRPGQCSYIQSGQDPDEECTGSGVCGASCNGSGACGAMPGVGTRCANCAHCDGAGACVLFPAGQDPLGDCTASGQETCGLTGQCDGQGNCAYHAEGTECAPTICQDSTLEPADTCDGAGTCVDGGAQTCAPYLCLDAVSCRTSCSLDEHCVAGSRCDHGHCAAYLDPGQPCEQDEQCLSGACADGFCCATPCDGLCQSCGLPGAEGTCLPVPDGQDPAGDCAGDGLCGGTCDGQGACRFVAGGVRCAPCTACDGLGTCSVFVPGGSDPYGDCAPCWACSGVDASCVVVAAGVDPLGDCPDGPARECGTQGLCDGQGSCRLWPAGSECAPSACADGLLTPADLCDGAGACVDSGEVSCAPYACLSATACRTSCADDGHCLPGNFCEASACEPLRGPGVGCTRPGQCESDACADGVCCDTACDGPCQRCDLAGAVGTCSQVPDGQDPDAECGGEGVCGGACDGAGGCRVPGSETPCGACIRCDGLGACAVLVPAGQDPEDACGPCMVCAGDRDACLPVALGEDPLGECPTSDAFTCGPEGSCDGAGGCLFWPAGTACGTQRCVDGTLLRPPACNGAGLCLLQDELSCAPYGCDGDWCAGPTGLMAISVQDAAGQVIGDRALTTDQSLRLHAVGLDGQGTALGPVMVSWSVEGGIGSATPSPSTVVDFDPVRPGQGRVRAVFHRPEVGEGATGLLTVSPGLAAGAIPLEPADTLLPADGRSSTEVSGGPVQDADGNAVADGTLLTVVSSLGQTPSVDADPAAAGLQRATQGGLFTFTLQAAASPGRARLRVFAAPPSTAEGQADVFFGDGRPVADAGPDKQVLPGARVSLDGSASYDPAGRELAYAWAQLAGPAVGLRGADGPNPAFDAPDLAGTQALTFTLVVSAEGEESAPDEVDVIVQGAEPDLPTAILSLAPESGPAPLAVTLDGSGSSAAACCRLTGYGWTFADDHAPLTSVQATRTFEAPGGIGVTLTVVDDQGHFASAAGQVSVSDAAGGLPPRLALRATPASGPAPLDSTLTAVAEDPEGGAVSLEWDLGGGFVPGAAERAWHLDQPGHHRARVRATDADGLQTTQSVLVSVSSGGLYPPRILSGPPATGEVGEPWSYLPVAVGSLPLTWSLGKEVGGVTVRAPEGMQVDPATGALSWEPSAVQTGAVEVSLVVRNGAGADLQDFTVEVAAAPGGGGCGCGSGGAGPGWALAALGLVTALRRARGSTR